ncbi:hypothetical protein HK098_003692 [Nowakowskiella sp. JEL0407]|nr:hypothetical protein HK098_003692 [Nowakowskiella sp. JEL0407]
MSAPPLYGQATYGTVASSSSQQPQGTSSMNQFQTKYQPSYAVVLPLPPTSFGCYETMMHYLGAFVGCMGSTPNGLCCFFPNPYVTVEQGSVGLISRFGRYYRSVDPGLHNINRLTETLRKVDVKIMIEDIPRQAVTTKDNVGVFIDSVLYWHVVDPYTSAFTVSDVRIAIRERTQTTLRHILGTRVLQEIIENRESIAHEIQRIIEGPAAIWGIKIESILIKDLQFSAELQDALAAAAKQKRIGESKIIAAQAEVEASKLMREASDILNTPAAMQMRYLDTLQSMARTTGAKVIFMPPAEKGMSASQAQILDSISNN